jgi:hypothetical protein
MMRIKRLLSIFLFVCLTSYAYAQSHAVVTAPELFWVSYNKNPGPACCSYLMQIDSFGNVVKRPIQISGGPTISSHRAGKINSWRDGSRDVLDEQTLTVIQTVNTGIDEPILVTQKSNHNFAILEGKQSLSLNFVPVSANGNRTGKSHVVSYNGDISDCHLIDWVWCEPGLVSADGKLVFWSIASLLGNGGTYFQLLDNRGRPQGQQKQVNIGALAVSNILENGSAFVIYIGGEGLTLQAFNPSTAQKSGIPILLAKKGDIHSVAVDPLARFVLYSYKQPHKRGFLIFQALDATGHPSGKPRVLVKRIDARNIHLL